MAASSVNSTDDWYIDSGDCITWLEMRNESSKAQIAAVQRLKSGQDMDRR